MAGGRRRSGGTRFFECIDGFLLQQQVAELVHALQQALPGKGFDLETDAAAIGQ